MNAPPETGLRRQLTLCREDEIGALAPEVSRPYRAPNPAQSAEPRASTRSGHRNIAFSGVALIEQRGHAPWKLVQRFSLMGEGVDSPETGDDILPWG